MERFKKCAIQVDKAAVIRRIKFNYGSVSGYAKQKGISRQRLYGIINSPHVSKDVECLKELAYDLGVKIEEIIL